MAPSRSVVHFDTEDALKKALAAGRLPADSVVSDLSQKNDESNGEVPVEEEAMDWVLPSFDPETTEVQSMKEELHRLQVLKSYLILDAEREESFERLTGLAARFFKVPIALISLVDIGRQWFLSNRGLGETRETPRKHAFCAHAILNKHSILIVPDATADFRFKNNPLVTGPPDIRFYAGVPLVSPEGYKLGTFCIIDSKIRPAGLNEEEQASLRDLADMAVKEMVERRSNMGQRESPAQLIAYTAHDLMTPLTGVQLSLSLLKSDDDLMDKLGGHQQELLSTAASCSDLMIRICQTTIDTLRNETSAAAVPQTLATNTKGSTPVTKISELIKSLAMIMEPIPKTAPLVISLDSDIPPTVMSDDLILFRSALNLISNGVHRTDRGIVQFRLFTRIEEEDKRKLVFECVDTGPPIPIDDYQYLFQPRGEGDDFHMGLSSVATLINSLDGEYGFCPLDDAEDGKPFASQPSIPIRPLGSLFWFSVPLYTPETFGVSAEDELPASVIQRIASTTSVKRDMALKQPIIPVMSRNGSGTLPNRSGGGRPQIMRASSARSFGLPNGFGRKSNSSSSVSSAGQRKIPVIVGDPMQAEAVSNSCLRDVFQPVGGEPKVPVSLTVGKPSTGTPVHAQSVQRKRRALIIEDSLVVRKSLARALEKLGFAVTQAVNGLEGLKSMKEETFDVVLCDFMMPVMDGLACVKQYRDWEIQHRPNMHLYIVGISAHADANDGNRGIKAGMDDFKPKPVSMKVLTDIQNIQKVSKLSQKLDEIAQTEYGFELGSSAGSLAHLEHGQCKTSSSTHSGFGMLRKGSIGAGGLGFSHNASMSSMNSKRSITSTLAGGLSVQRNFTFDSAVPSTKRQKHDQSSALSSDQGAPVCLLATGTPNQQANPVLASLEQEGWKVIVVHDGQEALRHLKMRNWNAVLIYDDIPLLDAVECLKEFRLWEGQNRVSRQCHVFLVCGAPIPSVSDKMSIVQPPTGYDGVLGKPARYDELNQLLGVKRNRSFELIV